MSESKDINIQYFALFRELSGQAHEQLQTSARTAAELYEGLAEKYGFKLKPAGIRVAVNEDFKGMDYVLKHGDSVVFIPPVSGG